VIAFDDDVDRADRRRARAVDERRAADDQSLKRTFAFIGAAVGGVGNVLRAETGREQQDRQKCSSHGDEHMTSS